MLDNSPDAVALPAARSLFEIDRRLVPCCSLPLKSSSDSSRTAEQEYTRKHHALLVQVSSAFRRFLFLVHATVHLTNFFLAEIPRIGSAAVRDSGEPRSSGTGPAENLAGLGRPRDLHSVSSLNLVAVFSPRRQN